MATRDSSGKMMARLREKFPMVDEFLHTEEIGFHYEPLRSGDTAIVPISNGCNNCCTFCVVPFTRGREVSRPYDDIINECKKLKEKKVLLVGQNVNSYGADIVRSREFVVGIRTIKPVMVMHMGRQRIPTLFPSLLEDIAKMGFEKVDFISSNPWDFSDELIDVIARNRNITRDIHLPVQSGDNEILKRMNRWYTREQYLNLVSGIKKLGKDVRLSTDIIVGFPGETIQQFNNTVQLCKQVGFYKAYISEYSDRPITAAHRIFEDDVRPKEKKRRWLVLEKLINKHE
jgi:tRNA-2-methylthio-N6-dimethylallyladenosine synthase